MAFIRKSAKPQVGKIGSPALEARGEDKLTVAQMLELARREGIDTSPLDVHALVSALGIKFLCVPMDDEVSGSLSLSENGRNWLIRVNALHHPNRQRFTVAHELAHFARHRSQQLKFVDQNFFRNGDSNAMEAEANRFAGELLMPESLFRDRVKLFSGSIEAVAQYFKVSTLAVRVRAKSLGMKGHGLE
ncbi:ImmA/IrrE family metallo-endopeptidase [Pseudomonas rhizophila]|uniref:ImmA/IrrE family metallo-endopeptidase n=1 Tax=Pseudomonas rhizophila TaxID=2045200 RepID=UPI0030D73307